MAYNKGTWKPGQSGNPNGRPPVPESWAGILREVGKRIDPKDRKAFRTAVAEKLWEQAKKGNIQAIKVLFNRMDGYPRQSLDVEGKGAIIVQMVSYQQQAKSKGND